MSTALRNALRKKFGGNPRAVLARLGLDENLLTRSMPSGGTGKDPLEAMRADIERLLGELDLDEVQLGRIFETLDKRVDLGSQPDSDPHAARARELSADDESEEERREKLRRFLVGKGMSDGDVDRAIDMLPEPATKGMGAMDRRPRRTSGSDDDFYSRFPGAALIEPGPSGAGMAFDRRKRSAPSESEADLRDFYSRFPDIERI